MNDRKEDKAERKRAVRSDRSKYKKSDHAKHERKQQASLEKKLAKRHLIEGRVLALQAGKITVATSNGELVCTLSGLLKKEISRAKNIVTVGDFVRLEEEEQRIVEILPRRSILSRREHLHRHQRQLIAANIDQVLITVSVVAPALKPGLIDRYIIATLKGAMTPVIVINKVDLVEDPQRLEALIKTYTELGFTVLSVSAETGEGLEQLMTQMQGKASVFSGQSGVGKSSLINAVTGNNLPTRAVVRKTQKGAHTTSATHLIPLPCGGWCIDTPGIRSFGLWDLQLEDLRLYFPEIAALGEQCRFPNCTHTHEPDCAVKAAEERGELFSLRLESYRKLLTEVAD